MKKWKIVADSGSDIRTIETNSHDILFEYVPLMINIDNKTYVDDESLDFAEFQAALKSAKGPTSSACPSPQHYANHFKGAENVICFTISSNLSGSYNSASLGKEMLQEENPDVNVHIYDSRSAGPEMNLLVRKAVELANQDLGFDEIVSQLETYHSNTFIAFLLQSVENLVKNGRVSKLVGQMVGLLNIYLVGIRTAEGTIDLAHKARGAKRGMKALMDELIDRGYKGGKVEISHAFNLKGAEQFKDMILERFNDAEIRIVEMSALCTYYAEENGIIVGYEK